MWQKCERLSWKTNERFTMFATLLDCRTECASEFCRMSSTSGTLQENLCQGCRAVIERNTAFPSALSSRNRPKRTLTLSPTDDKSWVFRYYAETKQLLSQWKTPTSPRSKKTQVRSNVKSMLIIFF